MKTNVILNGDALEHLKTFPDESIDCVVTSPPYWATRDYGESNEVVWGGDKNCEHDFDLKEGKDPMDRGGHGDRDSENSITATWEMRKGIKSGFCVKCGAWKGQLGLEPTFDLYIKHLADIFSEVKRILKKTGTVWINLGDSYSGNMGKRAGWTDNKLGFEKQEAIDKGVALTDNKFEYSLPQKCLSLIPFRFVIEMCNRGWICRNVLIWHKPNCMPSSVRDRFTVDFEYIFFFSKSKKYFFERQFEKYSEETIPRMLRGMNENKWTMGANGQTPHNLSQPRPNITKVMPPIGGKKHVEGKENLNPTYSGNRPEWNEYGRNKRAVWKIPTHPFGEGVCMNCGHFAKPKSKQEKKGYFGGEDKSKRVCEGCGEILVTSHFAIFPEELIETPIKAGCPEFICIKCGKPKKVVYKENRINTRPGLNTGTKKSGTKEDPNKPLHNSDLSKYRQQIIREKTLHKPTCNCNTEFTSGIILDPFFGAGTTGLVALKQNKKFIGIEINPEYVKIAQKRLKPLLEQTKL